MFEKGQKVRRVVKCGEFANASGMHLGHVYTIKNSYNDIIELAEIPYETWQADKFIPFKWKEGDWFKIVSIGMGLGIQHIGKVGRLEIFHPLDSPPYWVTSLPLIKNAGLPLCVSENMIEFVQLEEELADVPNAIVSVDVSTASLPETKQRRYLNKKES